MSTVWPVLQNRLSDYKTCKLTKEYVAALKKSVIICKFKSAAEQIMRYQNSDKTISSILREGLLLRSGMALQKIITTASQTVRSHATFLWKNKINQSTVGIAEV